MLILQRLLKVRDMETVDGAVSSAKELKQALQQLESADKAGFIDVRIHKGLRENFPHSIFHMKD